MHTTIWGLKCARRQDREVKNRKEYIETCRLCLCTHFVSTIHTFILEIRNHSFSIVRWLRIVPFYLYFHYFHQLFSLMLNYWHCYIIFIVYNYANLACAKNTSFVSLIRWIWLFYYKFDKYCYHRQRHWKI